MGADDGDTNSDTAYRALLAAAEKASAAVEALPYADKKHGFAKWAEERNRIEHAIAAEEMAWDDVRRAARERARKELTR